MIKQIVLCVISFTLTLVCCEIFLATSHIASVSASEFYNDIGKARRKNHTYVYFNEGFGIGRFNEFGYIGEARPPHKDDNAIRVLLIGDSFVESFQIFQRDYFGNLAESDLNKQFPDIRFEFLNFGMSGFDIADMFAYQKVYADRFDYDYAMYFVSKHDLCPSNDHKLRPFLEMNEDILSVSNQFDESHVEKYKKQRFLKQNLVSFNMLIGCIEKSRKTSVSSTLFGKLYAIFQSEPASKNTGNMIENTYVLNPLTQKVLESVDSQKVIIVNRDSHEMPLQFALACQKNNLHYLDLSQSLKKAKNDGLDPKWWGVTKKQGHWNHIGHRIVADEIAKTISNLISKEVSNK